ncbi:metallophosphoesterase 1 isoform X1 [Betta splendens]|uniref:Metallophosphoesterase 1 n=1 Tax=Betta splendens TaxID=158456 RepID=A0A6P7L2U7_BETSP|nr:metallophosphoesterase 1 isoform X1 [Betta splendens]
MPRFGVRWMVAAVLILVVGGAFFFCEYLIYFPTIFKCAWPKISRARGGEDVDGQPMDSTVRAMVLSDTHLLGAVGGHWFDKLRREWQMERAFQTALWLLRPEIVFILGDIFDEGKWSSQKHWEDDVRRFHRMFRHSPDTELVVLVGNHDIGFHYEMDWFKLQRFEKVFNASSTRIVSTKGVNFLLVNSVALHGDGCPICQSVEKELIKLSRDLNCSLQNPQNPQPGGGAADGCEGAQLYPPTPPIMLQGERRRLHGAGRGAAGRAPPAVQREVRRAVQGGLAAAAAVVQAAPRPQRTHAQRLRGAPRQPVPGGERAVVQLEEPEQPQHHPGVGVAQQLRSVQVLPAGGEHGDRRVLLGRRLPAAAGSGPLPVDEGPAAVPQPLPAGEAQVPVSRGAQRAPGRSRGASLGRCCRRSASEPERICSYTF